MSKGIKREDGERKGIIEMGEKKKKLFGKKGRTNKKGERRDRKIEIEENWKIEI